MGFFMKLLAWMARHGEAVALDQAAKPASSARRGAGTKEDVGRRGAQTVSIAGRRSGMGLGTGAPRKSTGAAP